MRIEQEKDLYKAYIWFLRFLKEKKCNGLFQRYLKYGGSSNIAKKSTTLYDYFKKLNEQNVLERVWIRSFAWNNTIQGIKFWKDKNADYANGIKKFIDDNNIRATSDFDYL